MTTKTTRGSSSKLAASESQERRAWTVAEVADMLGVGETTVREGVKAGIIPAVRLGSLIRIPKGAFERWLEQQDEGKT